MMRKKNASHTNQPRALSTQHGLLEYRHLNTTNDFQKHDLISSMSGFNTWVNATQVQRKFFCTDNDDSSSWMLNKHRIMTIK